MIKINTNWLQIVWALCFIISAKFVIAQTEKPIINFNKLTTEQGLSNNYIFEICQDSFGFIWIGTSNGLCRYDTKETFKKFTTDNSSLKSNNIRSLLADSKNQLWIGTRLGGVSCYNLTNGTWKTYINDPHNPKSLSNNEVLSLHEDSKGRIWVGTEFGLNLFDPKTESFTSWLPNSEDPNALNKKAVLDIEEDSRGLIWVGLWDGGLDLILNSNNDNPDDFKFRNFSLPGNIASSNVWKILESNDGKIWIGTHGGGIYVLTIPEYAQNSAEKQDWEFSFISINETHNKFLESNTIDDITQDKNGDFWFATTNGVHHLPSTEISKKEETEINPKKLKFHNYKVSNDNNLGLASNIINKIKVSKDGLIWVGTISGLSYFNTKKNLIDFYKLPHLTQVNYLNNNFVVQDNEIWIATGKNTLEKYSKTNRKSEEIKIPGIDSNTKLYSIHRLGSNELVICSSIGIVDYNTKTKKTFIYKAPIDILEKSNHLLGRYIYQARGGLVYISTEFGLVTLDKSKNKYKSYRHSQSDPTSISDNSINQIYQDSNDDIWISTYNGLNKIINTGEENLKFKHFLNSLENSQLEFKSNQIITLIELDKILYLGTTNGFSAIDINTETTPDIQIPNIGNYIISFEKDLQDNIWFSTTEGISCFNTKTKSVSKYNQKDGINDVGFRLMTSHSSQDGFVYFGSQTGIAQVNTDFNNQQIEAPPTYVTEVKTINNRNQEIKNVLNIDHIELDANNYYLELKFVGLSYDRIEETQYAYKLEGLDDDWFYTNKTPSAVYTNLKPGKYIFKAKAANYQGIWTEKAAELNIEKKATLLETKWFQILLSLLTLFLIWLMFKTYTRNIKKNNQQLKDFNTSLNDEIEERMKVEKDLLQTNKDLQQFAYSASHDLQEPLRNIGNAVGLLKRKNQFDDNSNEYVEIAVDGVKRMSTLIQNLLEYAKTGSKDILLEEANLNILLKSKLKGLTTLIEEKNATVLITDLPTIFCESNQLGVVFYNLINNAIKFNNKENPKIEVGISENAPVDKWQFYVKDNGLGIAPEYQNRIFTMFTRLENKRDYEGTGIGLTLCQKIVTRHNGTIWVSSTPNKGSTFFFTVDKHLNK